MSPFPVVVVLILTVLFIILSVIPLLAGHDVDSSQRSSKPKTKALH